MKKESIPALLFITILIYLIINPVDMMFRPFRYEMMLSFWYNIIAPIGQVRFKDFFLGDILTSMTRPLIDIYFIGCYFGSGEWE